MPATTPDAAACDRPRRHGRRTPRRSTGVETGRLVLTVLLSETLRWGAPFVGPLLAVWAWAQGWVGDPAWALVAHAALLTPLVPLDRRRRDVGAIGVALVAALAVFMLEGLAALAVLAGGWFVASVLATSLLEVVGCLLPEL